MKKNVKKFIFIIIILNCLLMFNNSYGVTYKKELSIDIAYKEWTMITRYIVASQNATIRRLSPEWYNLTSEQIKELDKNNNGKIDNNDLRIIKRHIEAMNNADVRKQHPDWIIYCEEYEVKNITLSETSGTLNIGDSRTIIATTGPTKVNNDEIVWQSNNTKVATVENGKITAISSGSAIITAKYKKDENIRAEYKLNVIANVTKITLNETSGTLKEGESKTLTATTAPTKVDNNEIIWQSSNTKVATVENGKITAVESGSVTITAKYKKDETIKAEYKLTVIVNVTQMTLNETSGTLKEGESKTLTATTAPTKVDNNEIIWQSSNTKVATVENGKITAVANGTAIITAKYKKNENIKADYNVTVVEKISKITLSETNISLKVGKSKTITATTEPTRVGQSEIKWQSSNTKVATVENGKIIAVSAGTTTITAKTSNGKTATATVTVTSSTTQNTPPAKKPTSASQLKLYKTSSGNSNPRYLKSPVTGKTEKVQSFAITDLGTSKETIWYAFQTYNNNKYKQTLINAYRDNNRVYSVALNYGGEGQGVDIDKIGDNTYSIYCQRNE